MIKFIWSIVKMLPLPLLFAVGMALGVFLVYAACYVFTVKYLMCGLGLAALMLFATAPFLLKKKKPCCHENRHCNHSHPDFN